jgi:biopolymer transport protein ExbB
MRTSKNIFATIVLGVSILGVNAHAAKAANLDELLNQVKRSQAAESKENKAREREFIENRAKQKRLLNEARTKLSRERRRGDSLKTAFDNNEKNLADMEETLERRLGNLGELFGVVRQVAGDAIGTLKNSLVSAQFGKRGDTLIAISKEKQLPTIPELEELWFRLQQEMTESGKIAQYTGKVVTADGSEQSKTITRIGVFNAVSDGKFLRYLPETGQLVVLPRQPEARFGSMASDLEGASAGITAMAIDPSRGSILAALVQSPDWGERIQQGREVGYIIIVLAAFGLLLALYRIIALFLVGVKVRSQLKSKEASKSNPLGRVLAVYFDNKSVDIETLERKLDEAIIKETPKLQRGLSIIKILAITAPLLGLLGTVTGMIQTFQSITLFGTGDPKLMAGGISQALMTTVMGLIAAIPLTFFHAIVAGKSKGLVQVLEEQSAGIIARRAEQAK